jgi:hypothetical protein
LSYTHAHFAPPIKAKDLARECGDEWQIPAAVLTAQVPTLHLSHHASATAQRRSGTRALAPIYGPVRE